MPARGHLPLMQMAQSFCSQGRLREAREAAEDALRVAPWDLLTTGLLARLLTDAGEMDRAAELKRRLGGEPQTGGPNPARGQLALSPPEEARGDHGLQSRFQRIS